MSVARMSVKQQFLQVESEWGGCTRCPLCETRNKVVNYRGFGPTDFLFIGEGPGTMEDIKGLPFVGPAGQLLEKMIAHAFERVVPIGWDIYRAVQPAEIVTERTKRWPRVGFANLVACIPLTNGRIAPPPKASVDECWPRLQALIEAANPKAIIRFGSQTRIGLPDKKVDSLGLDRLVRTSNVVHPAALLRQASMDKDYAAIVNEIAMTAKELGFGNG